MPRSAGYADSGIWIVPVFIDLGDAFQIFGEFRSGIYLAGDRWHAENEGGIFVTLRNF